MQSIDRKRQVIMIMKFAFSTLFVSAVLLAGCGSGPGGGVEKLSTENADPVVNKTLTEANKAIESKKYQEAMMVLMAARETSVSEQQSLQIQNSMRSLQTSLMEAAAAGDPNAKAAIAVLRASSSGGGISR
ncbi:MAG: hypothetical protein SFY81_01080 [Verrucomicrobiota bacterium]|nr:hypothetical protein [Verrucomicrobiota bacterium]